MVIRRDDRVSAVLARDEGLIDVFADVSPAFERLRNPAMRRVMSRLVTVEKAARIAGVDADELVRRLNAWLEGGGGDGAAPGSVPADRAGAAGDRPPPRGGRSGPEDERRAGRPAVLDTLDPAYIVDLDVREDLRRGREPFSRIMEARREIPPGGALRLRAIFEPVPLYDVLARQGFDHWTERLDDEDWRVWFYRVPDPGFDTSGAEDDEMPVPIGGRSTPGAEPTGVPGGDMVLLDVRGLEPPEPMVRTLEALETLAAGATLVQLNVRVPRFLLPVLEERGFSYEIREQPDGPVRVFIRHADGPPTTRP